MKKCHTFAHLDKFFEIMGVRGDGLMRKYLFEFEQEAAVSAGLDIKDLLLLDYLGNFFGSGRARKLKGVEGLFFRISYKKILDDLPILCLGERQLRAKLSALCDKGFAEKCGKYKNQLYLKLKLEGLYSKDEENPPLETSASRELVFFCGRAVGKNLELEVFDKFFYEALKLFISTYSREQFMSDLLLEKIDNGNFVFLSKHADFIKRHLSVQVQKSLDWAIKSYLSNLERFKRAFRFL